MKRHLISSAAIVSGGLAVFFLLLVAAKTFVPAVNLAINTVDTIAAATASFIDRSSGDPLDGDIYIGLLDRRGNTPVVDFSLEWSGFTNPTASSTSIVVITASTTATSTSGGGSSAGGFGGNDNFDGDATTTAGAATSTEPLVGILYLMKTADGQTEEVGSVREFYNMPTSGVLADPLAYSLGDADQKISDIVGNGKLARYFFEWRRGEEVATTSTFAIVPESITPKLYSGDWIKEGQSTASVWWFFSRVPTEAGLSGTLRLMKITDRTKQEVEEVTTFGPQPIANKSKVWDQFPDVVNELDTGEYFFELEHLSGKISSRPFKIADQNIELPSQTLAVSQQYDITWKSASGSVTGELWLLGQSGNGQKVADINPQDKKYTWTAPSSPQKNVYFEIRTKDRRYVSPSFSVTGSKAMIVPNCSFIEDYLSTGPVFSFSNADFMKEVVNNSLNYDEISFCGSIYNNGTEIEKDWYFKKASFPQDSRPTPNEKNDEFEHLEIMTSCVDFEPDIRNKFNYGSTSGNVSVSDYIPPTKYFSEYNESFIVPLGDSTVLIQETNHIELYSEIDKLNSFLWASGYLKLPVLPSPSPKDFPLAREGGSSSSRPFQYQQQINQYTNEAIKAFKVANNLPLVNQLGKSELDFSTRELIGQMTNCKKESDPIRLGPLSTVPSDFITAMKNRIAKSWDNALKTSRLYRPISPWRPNATVWMAKGGGIDYDTEKDEWSYYYTIYFGSPVTTYVVMDSSNSTRVGPGERGPAATSVNRNTSPYRIEKLTHEDKEFIPAIDKFLPGNTLERYLFSGGEDAYPTPVNYCTGVVGPGTQGYLSPTVFPYDFKRNNVCPYFSAGFDYTAQLSQDDFAYDDDKMKYDNLTNLLWTLSCVPRGVTDVEVVSNGVKAFQSANGLSPTGAIDQATGKLLDRMWSIPGLNTINTPNTYLPFVLEFDDEISGPPGIEMVKNLPGFLQAPNATGVSWGTRLFSPVIDFVPDTEQYYCPSAGQSPKHSLTITNNIPDRKFLGGNFVVYKKIKSATGSDYRGGGSPVLDLTWSSNNLSHKQKLAVFIDDLDNQTSVLLDPDFSITNKGFYPLPLNSLPAGKYRLRLEAVVNSYYDISNQGIAGFVSAMAPDFWQTEFPAEPADLKNHSTFNLLTRIIGALPPPPTYSVQAIGPTFEIRDETMMTDEEYADYLKEEVSAGIRRDIAPALQVPLR